MEPKKLSVHDRAVQNTSNDALITKVSSAGLGYFSDPFSKLFLKGKAKKILPIMNRGTWARVMAYKVVIDKFINSIGGGPMQILSLGCGLDSSYFNIKQEYPASAISSLTYIEVDFVEVVTNKISIIKKNRPLCECIGNPEEESKIEVTDNKIVSPQYVLVAGDLRAMDKTEEVLVSNGLRKDVPTLVLTECVLVYMKPEESKKVIEWIGNFFANAALLNFEMILPFDKFGSMMVENLEERGCQLLGIKDVPDLISQKKRCTDAGFSRAEAHDMLTVYNVKLPKQERLKIEKLELFDEFEEWELFMSHYCLVLAVKVTDAETNDTAKALDKNLYI